MVDICFVILHFKTYEITKRCIESILELSYDGKIKIVIVDNASCDGTGERLKLEYIENVDVQVLILSKSTGFSNGNNIGYQYCKKEYNPELIIMSNNDLIFNDKLFARNLMEFYYTEKFDILGPDVINKSDNNHCSPIYKRPMDLADAKKYVKRAKFKFHHVLITLILRKFLYIKNKVLHKVENKKETFDYSKQYENVCLWGACLVFSKAYGEKRKLPFYPETNFYHEEDILFYQAFKLNMRVVYYPRLKVLHGHSEATKAAYRNKILRKQFQFKNNYKGASIYLKLLLEDIGNNVIK